MESGGRCRTGLDEGRPAGAGHRGSSCATWGSRCYSLAVAPAIENRFCLLPSAAHLHKHSQHFSSGSAVGVLALGPVQTRNSHTDEQPWPSRDVTSAPVQSDAQLRSAE
ncbi:unnamed protein product [Polarella glacialis]|uniref:Uncharacterized protein n=1 Tax=Polarella glacialis TaxID=89957 RepID=A0A813H547_POLGL|nr:unnamed protein product [Polarella glacialis]